MRHGFNPADPLLKRALLLAPLVPVLLVVVALWRLYRNSDEYARRHLVNALAAGGALAGIVGMTMPILESAVLLKADAVSPLLPLAAGAILYGVIFGWREGVSDVGHAQMTQRVIVAILAVILPTALYALLAPLLGWPHTWFTYVLVAIVALTVTRGIRLFTDKNR